VADGNPEEFEGTERFVVRRRLGAGAFGVVYEALDRERDAIVALKTLRHFAADDLYRFKNEFRALVDVSHPNLLALHELLTDGAQWFFTMDRVEGVDFLRFVRGEYGGLPPISDFSSPTGRVDGATDASVSRAPRESGAVDRERLRAALRQLAEGVRALHAAGQLHRDIKPSNVLVTAAGQVVLLDFGLVRTIKGDGLTQTLEAVGTPAYMSPEQTEGLALGEASDWYSVGVMLFEALTGRLPFDGTVAEVLRQKCSREAPAIADGEAPQAEELRALCAALLRRDPAERPGGGEVLRCLGGAPPTAVSGAPATDARPPLVGRAQPLRALRDAFAAVKGGGTVTVSVQGGSGTGKTALVRRFLEDLRSKEPDAVILAGRCHERESVPYKALDSVVDALSRSLRRLGAAEAEAILPHDILLLARVFPVLRQVESIAGVRRKVAQVPDSRELRRRAFAALRELFVRLADRRPLVVVIDDVQWGDLDSATLLEDVLRPPDPPALLLVGCFRREEAETSPLLVSLLRMRENAGPALGRRDIRLEDLPPREARAMAVGLLGADAKDAAAAAETIARESGGNPFLIEELVRHVKAGAGVAVAAGAGAAEAMLAEAIDLRLGRLPADARLLLEAIAVAGQPVSLAVAARASGSEGDGQAALAPLRSAHLIRVRQTRARDQVEVYHERIRDAVMARLDGEALAARHLRLALALLASGEGDPEELALHYEGAGDLESASEQVAAGGARAAEALAFDRAARLYRKALSLRTPGTSEWRSVAVALGDALASAGRGPEAARNYLLAAGDARADEFVELHRRAAEQLLASGHLDEGLTVLGTVLDRLGIGLPRSQRRALAALVARRAWIRVRGLGFRERDEARLSRWELLRIDTFWSAGMGLALVDMIRGAGFQARHLLLALRAGEPSRVARALALEVGYASMGGSRSRARTDRLVERARALADRVGEPHATGLTDLTAGAAAWNQGRWREAHALASRAETILRERCAGAMWEILASQMFSLASLFFLGEIKEFSRRLPALVEEATERGNLLAATFLRSGFFSHMVWLAADDPEGARRELRESHERWSSRRFDFLAIWARGAARDIALYSGEGLDALAAVDEGQRPLARALDRFTQSAYILGLHSRARRKLALAAQTAASSARDALLREAEAHAHRIEAEKTTWGGPLAQLLRAGAASIGGRRAEAESLLLAAEGGLTAADMALHAVAARRCRGALAGDGEARGLLSAADEWMAGQGIREPSRMTALLVPGRWS
jgi:eukaryotic-like serine/threonine-protein kinase